MIFYQVGNQWVTRLDFLSHEAKIALLYWFSKKIVYVIIYPGIHIAITYRFMDVISQIKLALPNHANSSKRDPVFNLREFITENRNVLILLFFLVFVAYFNSIGNGFVSDDIMGIKNNPDIAYLDGVFSSPMGFIQRIIYFFDAFIFGLHPSIFRITSNFIFHIGNTFLVFLLLSIISKRKTLAIFAASLFAVHPILTEAVVWISGSPYVQSTFFALLSIITYILFKNSESWKKYLPFILFLVAMSTHPMMIVIPLLLALYELISEKTEVKWKKLIPYFSVMMIFGVVFLFMAFHRQMAVYPSGMNSEPFVKYRNPIIEIPNAVSTYIKHMIWPSGLSFFPDERNVLNVHANFNQYALYLSFFVILGFALWLSWKKNKNIFFWFSFFLISLIPTNMPMRMTWFAGERYVYFASIGLFVVIAYFFDWILKKVPTHKNFVYIIFAIILIAFSVRTVLRNRDWKNEETLYIATQKTSPGNYRVYSELGRTYGMQGNKEKAIEAFKKAIEINSYDPYDHYNIAILYYQNGQPDLALEELNRSIQLNPNFAKAYLILASLYEEKNQKDIAISNYAAAINADPKLWIAYANLGHLYSDMGDYQNAFAVTQKGLQANPGIPELQRNLEIFKIKLNGSL